MKKLISVLITLALMASIFACFSMSASAVGGMVLIYETDEDIEIDGILDSGYTLISDAKKTDNNWVFNELCTFPTNVSFYGCWKGDFLYLFVDAPCSEEHISYMDNDEKHYIFNGHSVMWALLPDNPYQEKYLGDQEDGTWSWGALYNAGHMYEWTTICDSREDHLGESDICDHFKDMSKLEGFEYACTANGLSDTYEVKIPMSLCDTPTIPGGIKAEEGAMFGIGMMIALKDVGLDYADLSVPDYHNRVQFSDYFTGDKYPYGLAYARLVSDLKNNTEKEDKNITEKYEVFTSAYGNWPSDAMEVGLSGDTASVKTEKAGVAKLDYAQKLIVPAGGCLAYDIEVKGGSLKLDLGGDHTKAISLDKCEDGLTAGSYKGHIVFENETKLETLTVSAGDGTDAVIKLFNIYPSESAMPEEYKNCVAKLEGEPDESEDPSEDPVVSEEPSEAPIESEPVEDESKPESKPTESSDIAPGGDEDAKRNTPLFVIIAIVAVAAIAAVVVIVLKKKKK